MLKARLLGFVLALALLVSACGGDATSVQGPAGQQLETGEAHIDSMEVQVLESFPVQVHVVLRGNLPDGCTRLGMTTVRYNGSDQFELELPTLRDPSAICTEAQVPYELTVPLDMVALEAGTYTIQAGDLTDEFTLEVTNVMPGEAGIPECPVGDGSAQAFVQQDLSFCLLIPQGYQTDQPSGGITEIHGEDSGAAMIIDVTALANGQSASEVADEYLDGFQVEYERDDVTLGGEPAVLVEGLPQGRTLIAVYGDRIYRLTLTHGTGEPGGDDLWEAVLDSFAFIPAQ